MEMKPAKLFIYLQSLMQKKTGYAIVDLMSKKSTKDHSFKQVTQKVRLHLTIHNSHNSFDIGFQIILMQTSEVSCSLTDRLGGKEAWRPTNFS